MLLGKVAQTLQSFICLYCWSIDNSYEEIVRELKNLSAITHTQLVISSMYSGLRHRLTLNRKTPEKFQKSVSAYLKARELKIQEAVST